MTPIPPPPPAAPGGGPDQDPGRPWWPGADTSRLGWWCLAGSLLVVGWLVVGLAREQGWGRPTEEVRFRTGDAKGIWPGVFVTVSGYRVGRVQRVSLAADGKVAVDLSIDARYRRLIGPGSRAFSSQETLLGDTVIGLTPDVAPAGRDRARADLVLPYDPPADVPTLLQELAHTRLQLDRTLQTIAKVVDRDLPRTIGSVDGTLRDVRRLATTLEKETGRTAALTRDTLETYRSTGASAGQSSREVSRMTQEVSAVVRDSRPELVGTLREIRSLAAGLNRALQALGGSLLLEPSGHPPGPAPAPPPERPTPKP